MDKTYTIFSLVQSSLVPIAAGLLDNHTGVGAVSIVQVSHQTSVFRLGVTDASRTWKLKTIWKRIFVSGAVSGRIAPPVRSYDDVLLDRGHCRHALVEPSIKWDRQYCYHLIHTKRILQHVPSETPSRSHWYYRM